MFLSRTHARAGEQDRRSAEDTVLDAKILLHRIEEVIEDTPLYMDGGSPRDWVTGHLGDARDEIRALIASITGEYEL